MKTVKIDGLTTKLKNRRVSGGLCVLWDKQFGQDGQMGTSVTWGTRRIEDVQD